MSKSEKKLNKSLKAHGCLFPENEEQLGSFLDEIKDITVPYEITDAVDEFKFERKTLSKSISFDSNNHTTNNLAQAARKGEDIPEEIKKKMQQDRENSKKSEK